MKSSKYLFNSEDNKTINWASLCSMIADWSTNYSAFKVNQCCDGQIRITIWNNSNDHQEVYTKGDNILVPREYIYDIIKTLREIPMDVICHGEGDSGGWPCWERYIEKEDAHINLEGVPGERCSDRLYIRIYYTNNKYKCNHDYSNYIYINNHSSKESFIDDIEPILIRLEDFLTEQEKQDLPLRIGTPRNEKQKVIDHQKYIKKSLRDDYAKLTHGIIVSPLYKRTNDTDVDIYAYTFNNTKLIKEDIIRVSHQDLAKIITYINANFSFSDNKPFLWERKYNNEIIASVKIEYKSEYEDNGIVTIKGKNPNNINEMNSIKIPFNIENPFSSSLWDFFNFAPHDNYAAFSIRSADRINSIDIKYTNDEAFYIETKNGRDNTLKFTIPKDEYNAFITNLKKLSSEAKELISNNLDSQVDFNRNKGHYSEKISPSISCTSYLQNDDEVVYFSIFNNATVEEFRMYTLGYSELEKRLNHIINLLENF